MSRISFAIPLVFMMILGISCAKEEPGAQKDTGYQHGVFIVNEGAYGNSNGSLSYLDKDSARLINHLFESVNGRPLGDVVQSFEPAGDQGFIVVNNSGKVEVVELKTFRSLGTIDGLEYPRYFLPVNDEKGYLTDGNLGGRVYVIDLNELKIKDTLPCGNGPEKMLLLDDKVFISNSGGWGNDSTLTVVDTRTDRVIASPQVGMNPVDMVTDAYGRIWILCKGKVVWNPDYTLGEETPSSLVVFDPASMTVIRTVSIGSTGDYFWPQHLGADPGKGLVYYLEADGLYAIDTGASVAPASPLIAKILYGFGVDPGSGVIYALSSPSFTTSGTLFLYGPEGNVQDSLPVGIGPSQVVFN
jgi:DNA-binding beta-propeller fold protein YncE